MTFDQQISRNIRDGLQALPMLSGVSVVSGNDDGELQMPRIVVEAVRGSVAIPGHAVYQVPVTITMRANAWMAASADGTVSGNQSIELLWLQVEGFMTGNLTTLSSNSVVVYGAVYDGGISDSREERVIERVYTLTLMAAPR
jgi:hypothetical protein